MEHRGGKEALLRGLRYHRAPANDGDSPLLEHSENGTFDKVIELQATSTAPKHPTRQANAGKRPSAHTAWQLLVSWACQLCTPRVRGLVLLNLVSAAAEASHPPPSPPPCAATAASEQTAVQQPATSPCRRAACRSCSPAPARLSFSRRGRPTWTHTCLAACAFL